GLAPPDRSQNVIAPGTRSAIPAATYTTSSTSAASPPAPRATAAAAAVPAIVTAGKSGKGIGALRAWIASFARPTAACTTAATRKPAPIPEIVAHTTGSSHSTRRRPTRARVHATARSAPGNSRARPSRIRTYCDHMSEAQLEYERPEHDVLAIAKTIAANELRVLRRARHA